MSKAVLGNPEEDSEFERDAERMRRWCNILNARNLKMEHFRMMLDLADRLRFMGQAGIEIRKKQSSIERARVQQEPEHPEGESEPQMPDAESGPEWPCTELEPGPPDDLFSPEMPEQHAPDALPGQTEH
jgi:hypothetical protein